jgi:hypothetical protein
VSDNSPGTRVAPWKPGQSGNPSGANAITKALAEFRKYMAESTSTGKTRLYNVWNRLYLGAVSGNVIAGKFIVEQCQGKAKESIDLSNEDGSLTAGLASVLGMNSEQRAAVLAELDRKIAATRGPKPDGDTGS